MADPKPHAEIISFDAAARARGRVPGRQPFGTGSRLARIAPARAKASATAAPLSVEQVNLRLLMLLAICVTSGIALLSIIAAFRG